MDPQIEKVLKLPPRQKLMLLILSVIVVGGLLYWFLYLPRHNEYKELQAELTRLQAEVDDKTRIANNLPRLQAEYSQLTKDLDHALTELPNSKEIPSLLTSITSLGKSAGLDFLLFRPKGEAVKDFYAEVPFDMVVSGTYYSVANFFVAVSRLSRIVNISNVSFPEVKSTNSRMQVKVACLGTTFRFLDKKEIKDEKKPK